MITRLHIGIHCCCTATLPTLHYYTLPHCIAQPSLHNPAALLHRTVALHYPIALLELYCGSTSSVLHIFPTCPESKYQNYKNATVWNRKSIFCKVHLLQSPSPAKSIFCKVHLLQSPSPTKSISYKVYLLQSPSPTKSISYKVYLLHSPSPTISFFKVHLLQSPSPAKSISYKVHLLQSESPSPAKSSFLVSYFQILITHHLVAMKHPHGMGWDGWGLGIHKNEANHSILRIRHTSLGLNNL